MLVLVTMIQRLLDITICSGLKKSMVYDYWIYFKVSSIKIIPLGCPKIVRCDKGTENSVISYLHPFLRRNSNDVFSGENSFRYGRSTSNQVRDGCHILIIPLMPVLSIRELKHGGLCYESGHPIGGLIFLRYTLIIMLSTYYYYNESTKSVEPSQIISIDHTLFYTFGHLKCLIMH